jgi:hypothetical protein
MRHDDAYQRAMHEWLQRDVTYRSSGSPYPSREATYDRRN